MSVFLRWGIFGILGVAGLMYVYNASKQMAARRAPQAAAEVTAPEVLAPEPLPPEPQSQSASAPASVTAAPHCEAELVVAQRALEARAQGEPLDRLLRIQEIAFEEPVRRARLEKVATYWFNLEGDEPIPEGLRIAVISNCVKSSPAP